MADPVEPPPDDGMEQNFNPVMDWLLAPALVGIVLAALVRKVFDGAEWALHKRRVIYTTGIVLILSLGWIAGMSYLNGV